MARLRASTQGTAVPGHGEPQGVLLTAVRTAAVANDEPWHGTSADRARQGHGGRDAKATVQRQSSNAQAAKESTERCRAQSLATRMWDPARPRPQRGRARCGQSTVGGPGATRRLARRAAARQSAQAGRSEAVARARRSCECTAQRAQPGAAVGSGPHGRARWQANRGGDRAQSLARWRARYLKQLENAYAMFQTLS